jgi:HD superfamily phosphohydrolase
VGAKPVIIRDVLHDYISLDEYDRSLLDCAIVQRLRHIKQNDVAHLVYPSLHTSRLEHSLGVMHIADQLSEWALRNADAGDRTRYLRLLAETIPDESGRPAHDDEAAECFNRAARWYGLLHDLGHLPFSHLTEHALEAKMPKLYPDTSFTKPHEAAAHGLIREGPLANALQQKPAAAWLVTQLLSHKEASAPALRPLKDIIDSEVDADRIDSTARDGLLSGGDYGHYDITRLTRNACLIEDENQWRVLFTTKAISSIESLLVERCKTYRWIHHHPKIVTMKNAYSFCVEALPWKLWRWHCSNYVDEVVSRFVWKREVAHSSGGRS